MRGLERSELKLMYLMGQMILNIGIVLILKKPLIWAKVATAQTDQNMWLLFCRPCQPADVCRSPDQAQKLQRHMLGKHGID